VYRSNARDDEFAFMRYIQIRNRGMGNAASTGRLMPNAGDSQNLVEISMSQGVPNDFIALSRS